MTPHPFTLSPTSLHACAFHVFLFVCAKKERENGFSANEIPFWPRKRKLPQPKKIAFHLHKLTIFSSLLSAKGGKGGGGGSSLVSYKKCLSP